jgi:hypothetical protein
MKKNSNKFSPKSYLKSGMALKLPFFKCLVPEDWRDCQVFNLFFARSHINGNVTFACMRVDLLCTGIKEVIYEVNIPFEEFAYLVDNISEDFGEKLMEISHKLGHNIIYGAIEYAEENGIYPHEDFIWAAQIIGPDSDNIPLVKDIPFGKNGMPLLRIFMDDPKKNHYMMKLEKQVGIGNFNVIWEDEEPTEDNNDEGEFDPNLEDIIQKSKDWSSKDWKAHFEYLKEQQNSGKLDAFQLEAVLKLIFVKYVWPMERDKLPWKEIGGSKPIQLTDEPIDTGYNENYPDEIKDRIPEIFQDLNEFKNNKSVIKRVERELKKLIEKYPHIPNLYNLHYSSLSLLNKQKEFKEEVMATLDKFPTYFFAKLDLIEILMGEGIVPDLNQILGTSRNLQDLFPSRSLFHRSEFIKLSRILILYYLKNDEPEIAYGYYRVAGDQNLLDNIGADVHHQISLFCQLSALEVLFKADEDQELMENLIDALMS